MTVVTVVTRVPGAAAMAAVEARAQAARERVEARAQAAREQVVAEAKGQTPLKMQGAARVQFQAGSCRNGVALPSWSRGGVYAVRTVCAPAEELQQHAGLVPGLLGSYFLLEYSYKFSAS